MLPQRYKFSSKSQRSDNTVHKRLVVVATAKVQIFKQITTKVFASRSKCGCCCYRKGTNFQANHNELPDIRRQPAVVVATAKVQIFKQITTRQCKDSTFVSCCCYRKGTNFQANHNSFTGVSHLSKVVVATAKVQIFKQITTVSDVAESRSSCCCYRKGTNFQANHNMPLTRSCVSTVVVATAKVQIFKQITTGFLFCFHIF